MSSAGHVRVRARLPRKIIGPPGVSSHENLTLSMLPNPTGTPIGGWSASRLFAAWCHARRKTLVQNSCNVAKARAASSG